MRNITGIFECIGVIGLLAIYLSLEYLKKALGLKHTL